MPNLDFLRRPQTSVALGMLAEAVAPDANSVGAKLGRTAQTIVRDRASEQFMNQVFSGKAPKSVPYGVSPDVALQGMSAVQRRSEADDRARDRRVMAQLYGERNELQRQELEGLNTRSNLALRAANARHGATMSQRAGEEAQREESAAAAQRALESVLSGKERDQLDTSGVPSSTLNAALQFFGNQDARAAAQANRPVDLRLLDQTRTQLVHTAMGKVPTTFDPITQQETQVPGLQAVLQSDPQKMIKTYTQALQGITDPGLRAALERDLFVLQLGDAMRGAGRPRDPQTEAARRREEFLLSPVGSTFTVPDPVQTPAVPVPAAVDAPTLAPTVRHRGRGLVKPPAPRSGSTPTPVGPELGAADWWRSFVMQGLND